MPIIKHQAAGPMVKEAVVLDLSDVSAQAERIRLAAEQKASALINEARRKAAELVENARTQGHEQGLAAGREEGLAQGHEQGHQEAFEQTRQHMETLAAQWQDVISRWDSERTAMFEQARQEVIEFALRLAEKVVHRTIEVDRSVVVDQVANALGLVLRPTNVSVRVHPDDKPILESALPELVAEFANATSIELTADANVAIGGCVLSFGQGKVDATIETQLTRIVDLILPLEETDEPGQGDDASQAVLIDPESDNTDHQLDSTDADADGQ